MHEISIAGKKYMVPSKWEEVKLAQLLAYSSLLYPYRKELFKMEKGKVVITDMHRYRKCCIQLLKAGLTPYPLKGGKTMEKVPERDFSRISGEDLAVMISGLGAVKFYFGENLLTRNLQMEIQIPRPSGTPFVEGGILVGPSDNFGNMNMEEFSFADSFFVKWSLGVPGQARNDRNLDMVCAILYRPVDPAKNSEAADYDGDMREAFNRHNVEARLPLMASVPTENKTAVAVWYEGCREAMINRYSRVFGGKKRDPGSSPGDTWLEVMLAMSGGKFGSYNETAKTPLQLMMREMERSLKEAEEIEKMYKK